MLQYLNLLLLVACLLGLSCQLDEKLAKFQMKLGAQGPNEIMNILKEIKDLEKRIFADEEEKARKLANKRQKIYQNYLVSRVRGSNILKDFYSGRY
jgi:hypothetical protein